MAASQTKDKNLYNLFVRAAWTHNQVCAKTFNVTVLFRKASDAKPCLNTSSQVYFYSRHHVFPPVWRIHTR